MRGMPENHLARNYDEDEEDNDDDYNDDDDDDDDDDTCQLFQRRDRTGDLQMFPQQSFHNLVIITIMVIIIMINVIMTMISLIIIVLMMVLLMMIKPNHTNGCEDGQGEETRLDVIPVEREVLA